jgi:hypothetical protein
MARYPQGATVTLGPFTVKDATGALTDAATAVVVLRAADGTPTAGSPYTATRLSQGTYSLNLPLTDIATIQHYQYVFTGTISAGVAGVQAGSFEVYDPFEVTVLSLQDAKDALNIKQARTADDAVIQR